MTSGDVAGPVEGNFVKSFGKEHKCDKGADSPHLWPFHRAATHTEIPHLYKPHLYNPC